MKLLVWGLGYVGSVSAGCFALSGPGVVGLEPSTAKVEAFRAGQSPVREPKLDAVVAEATAGGRLRATPDPDGLVAWADASFVCVGTPSAVDGRTQLDPLLTVV